MHPASTVYYLINATRINVTRKLLRASEILVNNSEHKLRNLEDNY